MQKGNFFSILEHSKVIDYKSLASQIIPLARKLESVYSDLNNGLTQDSKSYSKNYLRNYFLALTFSLKKLNQVTKLIRLIISFEYSKKKGFVPFIFFVNSKEKFNSTTSYLSKLNQAKQVGSKGLSDIEFQSLIDAYKKKFACFSPVAGLGFKPQEIKKPWGKEVWFTGIEERGFSKGINFKETFSSSLSEKTSEKNESKKIKAKIKSTDIDELFACFKLFSFLNFGYIKKNEPILLKILKPKADKIYGQLYYELHEKKKEVYIISKINQKTYPNQIGKIRLGFNQAKQKLFSNQKNFLEHYKKAILEYKKIRFLLDELIEKENASAATPKEEFLEKEKKLREEMESYSDYQGLKVGDVVTIPNKVPHALQAGVEAIEFQTPHYERLIISYPQKVLTQADWDTEKAFRLMKSVTKNKAESSQSKIIFKNSFVEITQCVDFKEFQVYKAQFQKKGLFDLHDYFEVKEREVILFNLDAKIEIKTPAPVPTDFILPEESAYLFPINLVNDKKVLLKNLANYSARITKSDAELDNEAREGTLKNAGVKAGVVLIGF